MAPLAISSKRGALIVYFVLVFALSWALWLPAALAARGIVNFPANPNATLLGLAGAYVPSLASILLTALYQGRRGLRALFRRLRIVRVGAGWYLFVLLWPALRSLLVTGLAVALGHAAPDFTHPPVLREYPAPPEVLAMSPLALLPLVLVTQFLGSSLGEELGWRGYALPRLQGRMGALGSSLLLGAMWGLWHLPRLLPFRWATFAWFMASIIMVTILYTWVFNNTRGSLWPVLLFHTSQAVTTLFLSAADDPLIGFLLDAILIALVVGFYGPATLARRSTLATEAA